MLPLRVNVVLGQTETPGATDKVRRELRSSVPIWMVSVPWQFALSTLTKNLAYAPPNR